MCHAERSGLPFWFVHARPSQPRRARVHMHRKSVLAGPPGVGRVGALGIVSTAAAWHVPARTSNMVGADMGLCLPLVHTPPAAALAGKCACDAWATGSDCSYIHFKPVDPAQMG